MRCRTFPLVVLAVGGIANPSTLVGQADSARVRSDSSTTRLGGVRVLGRIDDLRGIAASASEGRVGASELRPRPLMREGEVLETVPGLIVTQHSGDGKANQLFVRGFNLDHGTDFQTTIEGMPVNMPSHAHGQGYTDLNFLIPEFVDVIDYRLGVYHASLGDFGSAGGAALSLVRQLDQSFYSLGAGANGFGRLVAGASPELSGGRLLVGGEARVFNGPWDVAERLRKYSGLARYSGDRGTTRFSVLGMAYHNTWASSDQIPLRAVRDGMIGRFGQIDPTLGGTSERYSLSASLRRLAGNAVQDLQLFAISSRLDLYSNFTYQLSNPGGSDQFNQRERRVVVGGSATDRRQARALGVEHRFTFGLQNRVDIVNGVGLYQTRDRVRVSTVREDDVVQSGTGLFVETESRWHPRFRSVLGLRGDVHSFAVTSDNRANSGRSTAGILSPKASLVFVPTTTSELYISAGLGFHSNDARGTTITVDPTSGAPVPRVSPLVRSRGGEVGLRLTPAHGWRSTVALWGLDLDSELLFVGDGGSTEPSDRSLRRGVTFANFYRPLASLSLDADVSFARARLSGVDAGENHIPGALERVVAGGVTWTVPERGPFVSLRIRHFGSYPLVERNSVRATATTLVNGAGGVRFGRLRVELSVLNLLNARASDIQYYYASRLPGEPTSGVEDVHFHPVEPRQLRLSISRGL